MKKIQSILLVVFLLLGFILLTACDTKTGQKGSGDTTKKSENETTAQVTEKDELDAAKAVAEKFAVAITELDYNTLFECYAMDMESAMNSMFDAGDMQEMLDFYGMTELSDLYDMMHKDAVDDLKTTHGDDFKITTKVIDCTELDEKTEKTFIENCKIQVDSTAKDYAVNSEDLLDTTKIEKVVKVTVECTISGSTDSNVEEDELYCVFIDGTWKVVDDVDM